MGRGSAVRPALSFCPFRNRGRDSSEPGCAGEVPPGFSGCRRKYVWITARTLLRGRPAKVPPEILPAFESDSSGCRTGDSRVGERKTSCRTEDTVREGNVPPEFSPVMIRITAVTEFRLRIFSENFPGNKTENKKENARAFSLRFFR